jgi:hypothetical protein
VCFVEPINLPFLLHGSHPFLIMLCQLQPKDRWSGTPSCMIFQSLQVSLKHLKTE